MKTMLDAGDRREIIGRLGALDRTSERVWGRMSAVQMLRHCTLWEEMIHENKVYKRPFIGRLIGPMILKRVLRAPALGKNSPTLPEMIVKDDSIDLDEERNKLIAFLDRYADYEPSGNGFVHAFFGKMTRDQIGRLAYQHLDHHLKQFGV